ncbi:MAG: glycosyltransferase family 39 protein [Chloroflexi bacterium]|nr:glycosyltransferase family 39 protein [Chloroflexota bacterium]
MINPKRQEGRVIFGATLILYLLMGLVLVFRFQLYQRDAMARTVHALMIFFGTEPKLANIGFLWPPLPVLLQLPLVLVTPLRYRGLAGNVVTAFAGATCAAYLHGLLRRLGLRRALRYLLVGIFALNPMIFLYSANGKSEMISVALLVMQFYYYIRWAEKDSWEHLAMMGLMGGLAFLTRYEAVFLAGVFLLFIAYQLGRRGEGLAHIWAAWLLYGILVAYAVIIWVGANWFIMGHPFYFAVGPYSTNQFALMEMRDKPWLVAVRFDVKLALSTACERIARFFPAFYLTSALVIVRVICHRNRHLLIYLLLPIIFIFNALVNYLWGFPLVYIRYYILTIPISFILGAMFLAHIRSSVFLELVVAVILLLSAPATALMMNEQTSTIGEHYFIQRMLGHELPPPYPAERQMAAYIIEHISRRDILADTAAGSDVIFFTGKPALFVLPADSDFHRALYAPYGRVGYVLVPEAEDAGRVNQIVKTYPDLQHVEDVGWARLVYRVEGWRLYRVLSNPGANGQGD